jgi:GT2 family glycosyltransferase
MSTAGGIERPLPDWPVDEQRGAALAWPARRRHLAAATPLGGVRFSLIIVTKCRPASLRGALESSLRALPADAEVVVVDGDPERSAASVVAELQARHVDRELRYKATRPGTTRQRNVGIDAARGEIVILVDDDCTFGPGLFEAVLSAYEDPSVVGVTGRVEGPSSKRLGSNPHSRLRWLILGGGRQGAMSCVGFRNPIVDVDRPRDVEFMDGPLMSARRHHAAAVRFDERLTGYGLGDDDDFSYRLSRRGRIRYVPTAVVHHRELGWHQADRRQLDRLQVVNRAYLFRKNFRQTLRARAVFAFLLGVLCAHRALNREWWGLRGLTQGIWHVYGPRGRASLVP